MSTHDTNRWLPATIGTDRALVATIEGTRFAFGLGPSHHSSEPEARLLDVLEDLGPDLRSIRWGRQIHGRVIASLASEPRRPLVGVKCVGRCDGMISAEQAIGLVVWTADCVPVLMTGDEVVAAVHAGWRGAAEDIVGAAVHRFWSEFGVPARDLRVFLGPAISRSHYPVGTEVIEGLKAHAVDEHLWHTDGHVDLQAFVAGRLRNLGVTPSAIDSVGDCTVSSPQLASFRRDGQAAGRQWSLIYRPAGADNP
jgi:YfiH family protein